MYSQSVSDLPAPSSSKSQPWVPAGPPHLSHGVPGVGHGAGGLCTDWFCYASALQPCKVNAICCGQNMCLPPKSYAKILTPNGMVLVRGSLGGA